MSQSFKGLVDRTITTVDLTGVGSIRNCAFYDCTSLTSVTMPSSVTRLGDFAFFGCTSLTSVTISSGVTSLGDYAFAGCSNLTTMTMQPTTPPTLGYVALPALSNISAIYVPSASLSAYQSASGWSNYASKMVGV